MKVQLLEHMGSDLSICNAARCSFDKESSWDREEVTITKDDGSILVIPKNVLKGGDVKLLGFLAREKHLIPFAHPHISFRCEAPIAVIRQLYKHKVGFVESEVSRRYVDSTPIVYSPEEWRKKNPDKKQGSFEDILVENLEFTIDDTEILTLSVKHAYKQSVDLAIRTYEAMINAGVCAEQARFVLPLGTYSTWVWTSSLLGYARMFGLRNKKDAQKETRFFAVEIGKELERLFPVAWKSLSV